MAETSTTTTVTRLASAYDAVRALTETLASPLSAEDQTVQSMPDVSPTKWHRAHTTWFFETFVLEPHRPGYDVFDPGYGFLFNSYYEGVGPRHARAERGLVSRPGVAEVARYRQAVDGAMAALLAEPLDPAVAALVELGLHHEQQHQELLLMDAKHVLSRNPLHPAYVDWPVSPPGEVPPLRWLEHGGGVVAIGHDGDGFCFDNEQPRHEVLLTPFAIGERLVTCGEWRAFIDDGGYRRPELWLSEGWATVVQQNWEAPLYWERSDGEWHVFTLAGIRPVDPAEPVCHVSYLEADAYARWAGARLPTEQEWEAMAMAMATAPAATLGAVVGGAGGFLDPARPHPRPLGAVSPGAGRPGGAPASLLGEGWQWTSSSYAPYPGFGPAPGAVGEYNGKFMVNQYVLRGGSCATPPGHARTTYRNFFPASARWAFSGLRLARSA